MKCWQYVLLISVLSLVITAAQTVMDLEQAFQYAVEYDASLAEGRSVIRIKETEALQYRDLDDPQLRLEFDDDSDTEIALRFFISHPWINRARQNRGQALVEAEKVLLQKIEHELISSLCEIYVRIYYLQEDLKLQEQLMILHEREIEHVREQTEAYLATRVDLLGVQADSLEIKLAYSRDQQRKEAYFDQLRKITGLQDWNGTLKYPAWLTEFSVPEWNEKVLREKILRQNTDLQYLSWLQKERFYRRDEYDKERIPWFDHVQGSVSSDSGSFPDDSWAVQVGINLPFFSRRHAKHAVVREQIFSLQERQNNLQRNLQDELTIKLRRLSGLRETWDEYTALFEPYRAELESLLEDPEAVRQLKVSEYIRLQKKLLQLERSQLSLREDIIEALLDIQKTAGIPLFVY